MIPNRLDKSNSTYKSVFHQLCHVLLVPCNRGRACSHWPDTNPVTMAAREKLIKNPIEFCPTCESNLEPYVQYSRKGGGSRKNTAHPWKPYKNIPLSGMNEFYIYAAPWGEQSILKGPFEQCVDTQLCSRELNLWKMVFKFEAPAEMCLIMVKIQRF